LSVRIISNRLPEAILQEFNCGVKVLAGSNAWSCCQHSSSISLSQILQDQVVDTSGGRRSRERRCPSQHVRVALVLKCHSKCILNRVAQVSGPSVTSHCPKFKHNIVDQVCGKQRWVV